MKKLLLLVLLPLFISCSNNKIVGTWQEEESSAGALSFLGINIVSKNTYSDNGDYLSKQEWRQVIDGEKKSLYYEVSGTWEMLDDKHLRVKTTTMTNEEGTKENVTDNIFNILRLDDEELIIESKNITTKFRRVNR